jgi:AraC-like DNA-binding protein
MVAQNLYSANWNIAPFHLNSIFPHKIDQALNVLHPYFYSIALWYLLWHYKKKTINPKLYNSQQKLIRNWLLVFASILTIITINFTIVMVYVWLYDDKSIFLNRASVALLFASLVYVGMNLVIFFFPHIMYGLPVDLKLESMAIEEKPSNNDTPSNFKKFNFSIKEESLNQISKSELQLFTPEYRKTIATALQSFKERKVFLNPDFKLNHISNESNIPAHHLTYFFNDIKKISFSDWRNSLRIEEAKVLIGQGETDNFTLQSISLRCGFSSQNTFIRAFKSSTGTTPSTYLKSVS